MQRWFLVAVLSATACVGTSIPRDGAAVVTAIVDGDTIDVELVGGGAERVRLIGIDTPETHHPERPVECLGPEAAARTTNLVPPGTVVMLSRDREARDAYGRLLAYVTRTSDDLFVNLALVEEGLARPLPIEPNVLHRAAIAAAAQRAALAGLGLWTVCTG